MKVSPVHHGGVVTGSINPGTEPCHALFHRHTFRNREGPVYRVQFRVSVSSTVVVDVCPGKEARIGGDIPFPFLLQELELCWSILLDRCGSDGTWAGWDTAVCLDFGGVRASWRGHIPDGNGKGAPGRITTAVIDGEDFWPETFGPTRTRATLKVLSGSRQAPPFGQSGIQGWQDGSCFDGSPWTALLSTTGKRDSESFTPRLGHGGMSGVVFFTPGKNSGNWSGSIPSLGWSM